MVWFEEPVAETSDALAAIAQLAEKVRGIRLAGAEKCAGYARLLPFITGHCYDVIMPDIVLTSGRARSCGSAIWRRALAAASACTTRAVRSWTCTASCCGCRALAGVPRASIPRNGPLRRHHHQPCTSLAQRRDRPVGYAGCRPGCRVDASGPGAEGRAKCRFISPEGLPDCFGTGAL